MYKITIALRRRGSGGENIYNRVIHLYLYVYLCIYVYVYGKVHFLDVRRTKLVKKLKIYEHRHLRFLNR